MHLLTLASAVILTARTLALPASSSLVEHERRDHEHPAWIKHDIAEKHIEVPVRIGLTQSNLDKGHDLLMEVSQEGSSNYGKYYTPDEITELFAPSQASVDAIRGWLEASGIEGHLISQSVNKQWLQLDISVGKLEELLATEYYIYHHRDDNNSQNIACEKYHVPEHVKEHIDYISPGIKLSAKRGKSGARNQIKKRTFLGSPGQQASESGTVDTTLLSESGTGNCDVQITPECIKTLYNITAGTKGAPGNQLGIWEGLDDIYSQTDLDLFFKNFAPNIPQGTHPTLHAIDGAVAPQRNLSEAGIESSIDFQTAYPIIYPQNPILFQTDDPYYENNYTFNGLFNTFLDAIDGSYCTYSAFGETGDTSDDPSYPDPNPGGYKGKLQCGVYKPTNVISISAGEPETFLPINYQRRQCNEYMKLGMQGISVVFASGDSGVASAYGCLGKKGTIFSPDYPAGCPYVTTLGATYLPPGADAAKDEEIAVTRIGSGGGFSNIFPRPSYQDTAVNHFLTKFNPPYPYYESTYNSSFGANGGIYNRAGRGYPDFAALGDKLVVYNSGKSQLIGGTSVAAPLFASILTRINEERIAAGKATVGFVNPVLYSNPDVLHDITNGSNPGCGSKGFSCAPGWDPVTGLGTPDYPKMLKLFMSLP